MANVKQALGIWFPAHEIHIIDWITRRMRSHPEEMIDGRGTYQYHKLMAAIKWCKRFRTAVDVGGHVGLWSMNLAKRFAHVQAFEPVALHRKCFELNVPANHTLHPFALGEVNQYVSVVTTHSSSGDTRVLEGGDDVPMKLLDEVLPGIADVDFIKLDCEGYELHALRGAEAMLRRCHPVVCVEQKHGWAQERYGLDPLGAVKFLQDLGATLRREIAGDYILSWDDAPSGSSGQPVTASF